MMKEQRETNVGTILRINSRNVLVSNIYKSKKNLRIIQQN